MPAGRVSEHVWAHWDVLPTLATPGRRDRAAGLDGVSMRERCCRTRQVAAPERTLYWEFHEGGYKRAARRGKWKAVWLDPAQPIELYDLDADIGETRDLAATQPAIVKQFETFFATARTPSERWPGR